MNAISLGMHRLDVGVLCISGVREMDRELPCCGLFSVHSAFVLDPNLSLLLVSFVGGKRGMLLCSLFP